MSKLSNLCLLTLAVPVISIASTAETVSDEEAKPEVIVVIGTRMDAQQQTLEVPRSMTIINEQHIGNVMAQEISEVLRQTPSITTSNNERPLAGEITIRGFGNERININVDGVSYQQYSDGQATTSYLNPLDIDPSIVKAVEITRGADGVMQGSGAIGGQIQLITKGGWDYTAGQAGSGVLMRAGYADATNSHSGGVTAYHASTNYALALHANRRKFGDIQVNRRDADGSDRGQSDKIKNDGRSDDLRLKVNLDSAFGKLDSDTLYTRSEISELPFRNTSSWAGQPLDETEIANRFSQSLTHYYQNSSGWLNLKSRAFYQQYERERVQNGDIVQGAATYNFHNLDKFKDQGYGLSVTNSIEHGREKQQGVVTMFGSWEHNSFDDQFYDYLTQQSSTYYGSSKGDTLAAGVRHEADWQSWLSSEAGLRYDSYRRSSDNFSQFGKNTDSAWSGNLGLTLRPMSWLRIYARYNEGFRGPNLRELYKHDQWICHNPRKQCYVEPQPELKAEQSKNMETGIGIIFTEKPWADQFVVKLNWFDTKVKDYLDSAPYMYRIENGEKIFASPAEATHRDYSSKNIGELHSRGVELELTYRLGELDLFANYSKIRMDVSGVPNFYLGTIVDVSQPYINAPQDKINLGFNWQFLPSLNLSGVSQFASRMSRLPQAYLQNDMDAVGYQVHNLYLGYQPAAIPALQLRAGVENLADKTYSIWPDPEGTTLPGRNVKLAVNYHF